ncbi:hypothetical protein V1517DRAFT_3683 [Lipomyces orientalis]|uniref:Uncharacterized protein n=1 Tax=Lipomyces orientalis TaxID=1233043 RepID=A0ACC3TWJ8_9ASCO
MVSTPPPPACVSPSLSLSRTPMSSHNDTPVLDPVYVASEAAAAVLASDSLVQAHSLSVLPPTPAALATLNAFLDHLVLVLLSRAKCSLIDSLRNAVKQIFKNQLADDAIAEGEAELRTYIRTPEEEYALLGTHAPMSTDSAFDTELAWRMARVRCMVYSSLGNVEEADVLECTPEQPSLFSTGDSLDTPDLISPIATIFLTAILEFVAEHALLVAGRAVLSRYLVASASRPHMATGVLLLEEIDIDKLALDPQVGKVWRQWKKRSRELTLSTFAQSISTSPVLTNIITPTETIIQSGPDQTQAVASTTDIFEEAIAASPNANYKKVRPISVDNGVLSLDIDEDGRHTPEEENATLPRSVGESSIPVTPAIIQERRKSRPWSFHGQRFSLYESFAALTGTPFASPITVGPDTTEGNVQIPSTNLKFDSAVREGIDEEDSPQVLDQMIADVAEESSAGNTPTASSAMFTRQLLPEAFDSAAREQRHLETERPTTLDYDEYDDPNDTISDLHPTSPGSYYFNKSKLDNAVYEEEDAEDVSSYDDEDGDSLEGKFSETDDRNRSRTLRQSSIASEGKSNADNDAPVILLASAPPTGYAGAFGTEGRHPDSAASTSSNRLSTAGFSTKMKGASRTPTSETVIPGFGTTVPTEKVRKYIWISNQKFDDGSGSSGSNTSIDGNSPELDHVTFERLLKSDITYKLNLTPDKLREAKPFYGPNSTRTSLVNESSNSMTHSPVSRSGSGASISQATQSEPPTTRSSSSGSISKASAPESSIPLSKSALRRIQPKSLSLSHSSQSNADERPSVGRTKSLSLSATAVKHARNDSVKATVGATHELMNLLRLSPSQEDLKNDEGSKSRTASENSLEYSRSPTEAAVGENWYNSHSLQNVDVKDTPVPDIPEQYNQPPSPYQSPRQVQRKPSIMARLGFSGVISGGASKAENIRLPSTSTTGPYPGYSFSGDNSRPSAANSSRSSSSSLVGGVSGIGIPRPPELGVNKPKPRDELRGSQQDRVNADLATFLRTTGPDESPYRASCESLSPAGKSQSGKIRRPSATKIDSTGTKDSPKSPPKKGRKKGAHLLGFLKGGKNVAV